MQRGNYECSTPVFGPGPSLSDISLSEIRNRYGETKSTRESIDSIIGNPKSRGKVSKGKGKQRAKNSKKSVIEPIPKKIPTNSESDSEFETVNECEVSDSECEKHIDSSDDDLMINRLFYNTNNSTLCDHSPPPLYSSPNADRWDDYEKSIDISVEEEDETTKSSSDMFSSPVLQENFRDPSLYKCYGVPLSIKLKKKMLTASEISFSPKWPHPVASKYDSPRDIPRRKSHTKESKYSHLCQPRNDTFKRFVSPRRESSGSSFTMDYHSIFNPGPDAHHVPMKKGVKRFSPKPINSSRSTGRKISKIHSQWLEKSAKLNRRIDKDMAEIGEMSEIDLFRPKKNNKKS